MTLPASGPYTPPGALVSSSAAFADHTLAGRLAQKLVGQIESQVLRAGARLASIRDFAVAEGVSRFTVVQAYDRLVAAGFVESRRGAGFFVTHRPTPPLVPMPQPAAPARVEVSWLLRSMFSEAAVGTPGGPGLLPVEWLDADMVAAAVRAVGRAARGGLLGYGHPRGFVPLRQQIAARLQADGIPAHPSHHLVTTAGVTQGLDLILRHLVQPGDTVLVEDPAWFLMFARLAAFGARVVGVPRGPDGPDLEALGRLAQEHQPKLFIINAAVHNPTGFSLSAAGAYGVLRAAEAYGFMVVEDDTYGDLHPGGAIRLAALDGLRRVIYVSGFSKMLAASLRVGFIAAPPELVQPLTDLKMLTGLTTPELGERVVHRILADGQYRRHVERVRLRVDDARERCLKLLASLGVRVHHAPHAGFFVWGDCGRDTQPLALAAAEQGLILAPGSLFSPDQRDSTLMRFSVAIVDDAASGRTLRALLGPPPDSAAKPRGRVD